MLRIFTLFLNSSQFLHLNTKSIAKFKEVIDKSATIFVNGTAGKYEDIKYATGTREMLTNIVNSKAIKIVGGGDGVSAVKNFNLQDRFNFLSTGGGDQQVKLKV